jgi:hypothetical protein
MPTFQIEEAVKTGEVTWTEEGYFTSQPFFIDNPGWLKEDL